MWPTQIDGLLQFSAALISLAASWIIGRVQDAHAAARKHAETINRHLRVRSPHNAPKARHKRTAAIHQPTTVGERAADALAAFAGSWKFIIGQSLFIVVWIILNTVAWIGHWDPYPWILLNLCMSTQAMYTGPIVLLSTNRQAAKDRLRDDTEAKEVDMMSKQLKLLEQINRQQLDILKALHERPASPTV